MAKATINETVVTHVTKSVTLELSMHEAVLILELLGNTGGEPGSDMRKIVNGLCSSLQKCGLNYTKKNILDKTPVLKEGCFEEFDEEIKRIYS